MILSAVCCETEANVDKGENLKLQGRRKVNESSAAN